MGRGGLSPFVFIFLIGLIGCSNSARLDSPGEMLDEDDSKDRPELPALDASTLALQKKCKARTPFSKMCQSFRSRVAKGLADFCNQFSNDDDGDSLCLNAVNSRLPLSIPITSKANVLKRNLDRRFNALLACGVQRRCFAGARSKLRVILGFLTNYPADVEAMSSVQGQYGAYLRNSTINSNPVIAAMIRFVLRANLLQKSLGLRLHSDMASRMRKHCISRVCLSVAENAVKTLRTRSTTAKGRAKSISADTLYLMHETVPLAVISGLVALAAVAAIVLLIYVGDYKTTVSKAYLVMLVLIFSAVVLQVAVLLTRTEGIESSYESSRVLRVFFDRYQLVVIMSAMALLLVLWSNGVLQLLLGSESHSKRIVIAVGVVSALVALYGVVCVIVSVLPIFRVITFKLASRIDKSGLVLSLYSFLLAIGCVPLSIIVLVQMRKAVSSEFSKLHVSAAVRMLVVQLLLMIACGLKVFRIYYDTFASTRDDSVMMSLVLGFCIPNTIIFGCIIFLMLLQGVGLLKMSKASKKQNEALLSTIEGSDSATEHDTDSYIQLKYDI